MHWDPGVTLAALMRKAGEWLMSVVGVPAHEALAWLEGREAFWPSIWGEQTAPQTGQAQLLTLKPRFVPVARDGTTFNPGLRRAASYTVGPKGTERQIIDFDEALQEMAQPFWRRPNDAGAWGVVRGVSWLRPDEEELDKMAEHPERPLPRAALAQLI